MPDKYGFNELGNTVSCIECDEAKGFLWEWNEKAKRKHFFIHTREKFDEQRKIVMLISKQKRTDICRLCGSEFEQERKRGRPRIACYICKPLEVE